MAQRRNIHPAKDEEALELFVRGSLSEEEQRAFQRHVARCASCRRLVAQERMVAAAAKVAGRADLKKRLQERLGAREPRKWQWLPYASAAAVMLIILGVGIFYRWYLPRNTGESAMREVAPPAAAEPTRKELPPSPQRARAVPPSPTAELKAKAPAPKKSDEERAAKADEFALERLDQAQAAATFADSSHGTRAVAAEMAAERPRLQQAMPESLFVSGVSVDSVMGRNLSLAKGPGGRQGMRVSIGQTPLSSSQKLRIGKASGLPQQVYPATIIRSDGGIEVVLSVDSLLPANKLHGAFALRAGRDSLVVQLPDRRILFSLPPGWLPVVKENQR